jgi:hypothetical protein
MAVFFDSSRQNAELLRASGRRVERPFEWDAAVFLFQNDGAGSEGAFRIMEESPQDKSRLTQSARYQHDSAGTAAGKTSGTGFSFLNKAPAIIDFSDEHLNPVAIDRAAHFKTANHVRKTTVLCYIP